MIDNVESSGVIMTRCLEDGSPYYVINYDDESGKTDSVTGGTGVSKTVFIYKGADDRDFDSSRLRKMVNLARRLEEIFNHAPLDIEFGLDHHENAHLFQVRRISTARRWLPEMARHVSDNILFVDQFVRQCLKPKPEIFGDTTILGVMPDWNPAEIIGVTPRPLAASLYRELVTRRVWSKAREEMGYRRLPPEELMVMVSGRPYIDVRNSFNSFLPEGVPAHIGRKLVNGWLKRLDEHPELHDKVEFEVAFTVHDLDFSHRFQTRYPGLLSPEEFSEYKSLLLAFTNNSLRMNPDNLLGRAEQDVASLAARQVDRTVSFREHSPFEILATVNSLLEECREWGTRPFTIVARLAFIAETLLRSTVDRGALSTERLAFFKRTIATVSGKFTRHFRATCLGEMDKDAFFKQYGHLRPGTYDILSPRYADRIDLFDDGVLPGESNGQADLFELSRAEKKGLDDLLRENGITTVNAEGLLAFASRAVAGREYAKFVFTRNLSDALEGLAAWGRLIGFDRAEMSFLSFPVILETLVRPLADEAKDHFRHEVEKGRTQHRLGRAFKYSYLIRSPRDVYIVPQHRSAPNFISQKRIEAPVVELSAGNTEGVSLHDRIVCIENADPGYDWIFTKGIAGLVTKYGGTNSHMAIRCAEFSLPAAIGCGEMLYERITVSGYCEINGEAKQLHPGKARDRC